MAVTKEILQSHPVKNLKAELRKVKKTLNYGKLKKDELIKLMLKPENINFFKHIKMFMPPPRKPKTKKEETKEEETKKDEKDNIPYEKTLYKTLFQYSRGDPVDFQCYAGMSFYLFLEVLLRNKNDCVLGSAKDLFENFNFGTSQYGIGIRDFKNQSQQILNKYEECAKRNKILVYPIFKPGHANMLVFNYKLNQIEYYEPHGKGSKGYENAIKKLVEYFKKNGKTKFSKNIQYSPSIKSCPIIPKSSLKIFKENDIQIREDDGLQAFDGTKEQEKQRIKNSIGIFYKDTRGFCCMWSFLYMDFRLKNPTSPTNQLGNDLMKIIKGNPKKFFREYIRGYTFDIMKRLNKLIGDQFLYAVNHPNEKFYRENKKKINDKFKSVIMKMWNDAGGK